mmetsp:Transcript_31324/g.100490  ORF Transcript_31324/g.100490 Transcript_31324/m.100490 type:complete len:230 (+) Transcript_31324:2405-3094(+)
MREVRGVFGRMVWTQRTWLPQRLRHHHVDLSHRFVRSHPLQFCSEAPVGMFRLASRCTRPCPRPMNPSLKEVSIEHILVFHLHETMAMHKVLSELPFVPKAICHCQPSLPFPQSTLPRPNIDVFVWLERLVVPRSLPCPQVAQPLPQISSSVVGQREPADSMTFVVLEASHINIAVGIMMLPSAMSQPVLQLPCIRSSVLYQNVSRKLRRIFNPRDVKRKFLVCDFKVR